MSNGQTVALIITVVIAALIAAGFLLSRALTSRFMHIALDRTLPGDMERAKELLSGNVSYEEITARVEKGAAYLLSSGCEEIHVTAPDGIDLVGRWYECEHAERAIIVMHGVLRGLMTLGSLRSFGIRTTAVFSMQSREDKETAAEIT